MSHKSLLQFVEKRIEYLNLMTSTIAPTGSQKHKVLHTEAMEGILRAINSCKGIPADAVSDLHSKLSGVLSDEAVNALLGACNAKVDLSNLSGAVVQKLAPKQVNLVLDNYLTEQHWSVFTNPNHAPRDKLMVMAAIFVAIGLHHSDEKTKSLGCALSQQTNGFEAKNIYAALTEFRELLKAALASTHSCSVLGPEVYPEAIEEFKAKNPELFLQAFPAEPPTKTKWNNEFRAMVLRVCPCRDTKTGVQQASRCIDLKNYNPALRHSTGPPLAQTPAPHKLAPKQQLSLSPPQLLQLCPQPLQSQQAETRVQPQQLALALQETVAQREAQASSQPLQSQQAETHEQPQQQLGNLALALSPKQGAVTQNEAQAPTWTPWPAVSLAPGGGLQPTIEQEKAPRKSMKDVVAVINDKVKSGQESITDNEPSTAKQIKATATPKKTTRTPTTKANPKKRPASCMATQSKPPCPTSTSGPINYKCGRIYMSTTKKKFRVICEVPNYATEAKVAWGEAGKPTPATWAMALQKIDEYVSANAP